MSSKADKGGKGRLRVVLAWHMHQPQYRDLITGVYRLPWTYLHAVKDYVDMAAHLEACPGARAVVNFAPILLEQISDYAEQTRGYLNNAQPISDPLLAALVSPVLPVVNDQRAALIRACLRANEQRLIQRFTPFNKLAQIARLVVDNPDVLTYLDDQFLADILVWYHLAWLGESVRREDGRVLRLQEKGSGFSLQDRSELLGVIADVLESVLPRYRKLAEAGRVELSVTPYAHPILPLLLDIRSAREAMPEAPLPELKAYPGGLERARRHVEEGIETFETHFGFRPSGCWPAEGGVSSAALALLGELGFDWVASGQSVLHNSLQRTGTAWETPEGPALYHPYRAENPGPACFFRDDGLSDLIGFTYANWHADDAVADLIRHLETIASHCAHPEQNVVSIILDGENAWEYYPENGQFFLSALYKRLAEHPGLDLTTFSACVDSEVQIRTLGELVAGSWVYGTFSTWIGDKDKNRGWDMLGEAKRAFDEAVAEGRLMGRRLQLAERQLAVCEGSDWFWWFGDYNPADTVSDFEQLFRRHLSNLYQLIGVVPPEYLSHTFTTGKGRPQMGGVMRPGQAQA